MSDSMMLKKIEWGVIALFSLAFLIWAVSKCNRSSQETTPTPAVEANTVAPKPDSIKNAAVKLDSVAALQPATIAQDNKPGTNPTTITSPTENGSRLYITIDKLKLRKEPRLNGEVLLEFSLFDEVTFLNDVTDTTTKISLGYEIADEPWVKVRHAKGQEGWVYGAGVHYYRKKRSGVIE